MVLSHSSSWLLQKLMDLAGTRRGYYFSANRYINLPDVLGCLKLSYLMSLKTRVTLEKVGR